MATQIEIVPYIGIEEGFLTQIQTWANQVLERSELLYPPPYLCINIWKSMEELQTFYQREKEALLKADSS